MCLEISIFLLKIICVIRLFPCTVRRTAVPAVCNDVRITSSLPKVLHHSIHKSVDQLMCKWVSNLVVIPAHYWLDLTSVPTRVPNSSLRQEDNSAGQCWDFLGFTQGSSFSPISSDQHSPLLIHILHVRFPSCYYDSPHKSGISCLASEDGKMLPKLVRHKKTLPAPTINVHKIWTEPKLAYLLSIRKC